MTKTASPQTLYAARPFRDAGTGRSFEAGKLPEDVKPGEIENYRAAGLVSDQKPEAPADA